MVQTTFFLTIASILSQYTAEAACAAQGTSCTQDCDCCGYGTVTGTVCQTRDGDFGPKCYLFRKHYEECTVDADCRSQRCENGKCIPMPHEKPDRPVLAPVTYPTDDLAAVRGELTTEPGTCPCTDSPTYPMGHNPEKLLSEGSFISNYPIGSGFLVRPSYHFPVRKILMCTSDKDPSLDPSYFVLKGRCKGCEEFVTIDENAIELPLGRNKCSLINVKPVNEEFPRLEFDQYEFTFTAQRGPFTACTSGCQDYPIAMDNVVLLGYERDRNLCKMDTRVYKGVSGAYYTPPAGACPVCMGKGEYPNGQWAGMVMDGTVVPYTAYKAIGAGILFEGIERAVNLIRIYPADASMASDPKKYKLYGATDFSPFQEIASGMITLPSARNSASLASFVDIEFTNEVEYEYMKLVFEEIEGGFDMTCPAGETCMDYPLSIGEIEFYGWC